MNDDQSAQYPEWLPSALRKSLVDIANLPPMRVGEPPFTDLADLWSRGELWWFVEQGIVTPCVDCGAHIGVPDLAGRCVYCDEKELKRDMPTDDRLALDFNMQTAFDALDLDMRTAFGYTGAEDMPVTQYVARDASYWDNREFRGWKDFRIQILTVKAGLSRWAWPVDWTLLPDALPAGSQASRLVVEKETVRAEPITWDAEAMKRRGERIVVFRVRLWRVGEPGPYLQGLWSGQRQRIRWDLCDFGGMTTAQRKHWDKAQRETLTVGPARKWDSTEQAERAVLAAINALRKQHWTDREITIDRLALHLGYSRDGLKDNLTYFGVKVSELKRQR